MNNEEFRKQAGPVACPENPLADLSEFTVTETHKFNVDASYGRYDVKISPLTRHGLFEHSLYPNDKGELWFDGNELVDYSPHLPQDVKTGLKCAGFVVNL